jgi:hypothetical protein
MSNSAFTSLSLKIIGLILIISSLLDYIILAIPLQITDTQWQIGFATRIVDLGVIPMVGMAFMLAAFWIDGQASSQGSFGGGLKLPLFILASFLGLLFLLIVPLHLNNLKTLSASALERIQQGATVSESQVQTIIQNINALAQNPQQLNEQIQRGEQLIASAQGQQVSPQDQRRLQEVVIQTELLKQIQAAKTPEEKEQSIKNIENTLQTQLRDQKLELEGKAKTEAFKGGLKTGLSSLMLAIGYGAIGALGLKSGMSGGSPRRPAR